MAEGRSLPLALALDRISEELARLHGRALALQDAAAGGGGEMQDLDRMTQELEALSGFVGGMAGLAREGGADCAPLLAAVPLGDLRARLSGEAGEAEGAGDLELL